jgi:hemerythrin-like domain-containing protein
MQSSNPMQGQSMPAVPPVREHFLADHERLDALLEQLVAALVANDRQAISTRWAAFETGLLAHLDAEDAHLIPALAATSERDARVLVQEHRHLRRRLTELGTGDWHKVWLDSARDFIDELRAHARTEDRLLYRWAEAHPDEPRRSAVIDALATKAGALTRRTPSAR